MASVGLDLGSQKTMVVTDGAEIIRNETGSISRPTLVSFADKRRLFGEEAFAQLSHENTIALLNLLAGRSLQEATELVHLSGRKLSLVDDNGRVVIELTVNGQQERYFVSSLLGSFIAHLSNQIMASTGPDSVYCFALPSQYTASVERAYRDAAAIAGIPSDRVFFADAADCLVAAYSRKVAGLGGPDQVQLQGKRVLLLDMGSQQSTAVLVQLGGGGGGDGGVSGGGDGSGSQGDQQVKRVAARCDHSLGAYHFDLKLFDHFNSIVGRQHGQQCTVNSKRGGRLLSGCERIRKLLSQLHEAAVTVESLTDSGDVSFSLKREELGSLCGDLLTRLRSMIAGLLSEGGVSSVDAVEIVGGGARMPAVQQIVASFLSSNRDDDEGNGNNGSNRSQQLGFKLDDGSLAVGAALLHRQSQSQTRAPSPSSAMETSEGSEAAEQPQPQPEAESTAMEIVSDDQQAIPGLSSEELRTLRQLELSLQGKDEEVRQLQAAYNQLESYILEMRKAPRQPFGDTIDSSKLNNLLEEAEGWLWDRGETASLHDLQARDDELRKVVNEVCGEFFRRTEEERVRVEQQLQEEAARAAAEREANGEEDEDHDNRRLKFSDRQRLVNKNREEGTELFKGGNYRPAAARYHKALTHAAKFFDLSPENEEEVRQVKVSLHCNLAACYAKLDNWEQVQRNCDDALKLEPACVKALFRRGAYHEQRRDWEAALSDYKRCAELNRDEDKLVTKAVDRCKKEIAKLKDKEKKMWGKAFS